MLASYDWCPSIRPVSVGPIEPRSNHGAPLPDPPTGRAWEVIQHDMATNNVPNKVGTDLPRVFNGDSGTECENFIRKLRKTALAQEKLGDSQWMAQRASTGFSGRALQWYVGLDNDTKSDWEKLEPAMLEMWPSDGGNQDDREENILLPAMRRLSEESTNAPSSSSSEDNPVSSTPETPSILSRIRLIIEPSSASETFHDDFLTVRE
ncbi:hypothetical protein FRB99_007975, partial [Tulasnella sp. 403]